MAKKVDITIPNIIKKFHYFNGLFFNNELKTPNFRISTTHRQLGLCSIKNGIPTISVSNYYDVQEEELENTLIHEMVHLYEWQKFQRMTHKETFKAKALDIAKLSNNKYIITRTNKRDHSKLTAEGQRRAEKLALNAKDPIYVVALERSKDDRDVEYAWLIKVTDKYYEEIFNMGRFSRSSNLDIVGFLYSDPTGEVAKLNLPTCRTAIRGKKQLWSAFCNQFEKPIVSQITKKHKINQDREFISVIY